MQPNSFDQAEQFLTLLDEGAEAFTFQTFDDKKPKRPDLARVFNGTLEEHYFELEQLNQKGAGVFVTVNQTDLTGRKAYNILRARAVWQEADEGIEQTPIEPHITVETSPGKFHRYFLTSTTNWKEWQAEQNLMADKYGSDPSAKDKARVMRLPGFMHQKGEPHKVKITERSGEPPLPWDAVKAAFPASTAPPRAAPVKGEPVSAETIADLKSALDYLVTKGHADNEGKWIAILYNLRSLGEDGFDLFREFSQKAENYQLPEAELIEIWHAHKNPETTYRAIFEKAQKEGWTNPRKKIELGQSQPQAQPPKAVDFNSWMGGFTLTREEAEMIQNPYWIYPNLIIRNHLIVIPAPPNGGKTTILFHISREIARKRYRVYYINADISGGDAKEMVEEAKVDGVNLLLPDFKGSSMEKLVEGLLKFVESGEDFNQTLFVFDTLKKMTDVISKTQSKKLYSMLRRMTAQGATIILLAHTNKYRDAEGNYIFEGTGDLRSDVDEMIYLTHIKNDDGSMTVSTNPDKVRGSFEPITFHIDADRNVELVGYMDTKTENCIRNRRHHDEEYIRAVDQAISKDIHKTEEIVTFCKNIHQIGARTTRRVLRFWSEGDSAIWDVASGMNNAKRYHARKKQI